MQRCRPRKRTSDVEEVSTQSQQVKAFGSHLAQPTADSEDSGRFRQKVTEHKDGLKAMFRQRVHEVDKEEVHRRKEMFVLIVEALGKPTTPIKNEPSTFGNTKIVGNSIFSSAIKVNTTYYNMLSQYYDLESMIEELVPVNNTTIIDKWMQDIEETERLLRVGHKTAARNVKRVLGMESDGCETDEGGQNGIGVLEKLNMELREGLRYTERGVKRMVKGIPKGGG